MPKYTIAIEIPDITEDEGGDLVKDIIKKFPAKAIKFEVRNAQEATGKAGTHSDLQRVQDGG